MKAKKAVKQLERRLRDEPENLALRVRLAGALRDAGRLGDAVAMYRVVALAYQRQERLSQASAVCRSALEIAPEDPDTLELLRQLEEMRAHRQEAEPTVVREERSSLPSLSPGPAEGSPARNSPPPPPRRSVRPSQPRKRYSRPSNEPRRRSSSSRQGPQQSASRPPGVPGPPEESPRPQPPPSGSPHPARPPPGGGVEAVRASPSLRSRGRRSLPDVPLPDARDDFEDAATRVAGDSPYPPGPWNAAEAASPGADARAASPLDEGAETVVRTSEGSPGPDFGSDEEEGRAAAGEAVADSMTQVFERSFRATLESLAPDGSAIDVPLSVFSELPSDVLDQLVRGMSLRAAEPGEVLVREGEIGDACFVIASGEVRVLKREPTDPHGDPIEVARLGHGAVFGEFALLADRRRHATVEVVTQAELFEIPRRLASELAASYPDVRPALERFYRERLLSTLLTTTPLFRPLPAERRADVLAHFHPRRAESGDAIVREGEDAGGLYLLVLGQVEITKQVGQKRSVLLATLGEGAYFGEMSLLHGEPASASVTATGPTELAVLPAESFYEIVAEYPVLWEAMKREVGRRDLDTHRIVAGNTSLV